MHGSIALNCVETELYTVTQAAAVELISLSEPIAAFPSQLTVHVLTELNSQIPGEDWNTALSQDNRATRHHTHLTHTLIIKLHQWSLQTATPPNTYMGTHEHRHALPHIVLLDN